MCRYFAVALAARLLDVGMQRRFVYDVFRWMLEGQHKIGGWNHTLREPPKTGEEWFWEFADGEATRVRVSNSIIPAGYQPPWITIEGRAELARSYRPITIISIDMLELHRRLWQK